MEHPEGIIALLAGKKKPSGESDDGEPESRGARAVRDLFRAAKDEDWEAAEEAFHRAYVECGKSRHEEAEGEGGDDEEDEGSDDYEE